MEVDERLLRLELRVDHVEAEISGLRGEEKEGRQVINVLHDKIGDIKDILTEHVLQENRDRIKLFVGISGALVAGIGVLVLFIIQMVHRA